MEQRHTKILDTEKRIKRKGVIFLYNTFLFPMKFLLFLVVCFSIPRVTFSQNPGPNISLQKCFSTSGRDSFHAFKKLNDGNYLATAYFSEKDYFLSNDTAKYFYLLKLDPNFNVIWKKSIPVYA